MCSKIPINELISCNYSRPINFKNTLLKWTPLNLVASGTWILIICWGRTDPDGGSRTRHHHLWRRRRTCWPVVVPIWAARNPVCPSGLATQRTAAEGMAVCSDADRTARSFPKRPARPKQRSELNLKLIRISISTGYKNWRKEIKKFDANFCTWNFQRDQNWNKKWIFLYKNWKIKLN